jgi:glycosyltransferase involved in cell wall biosynthesis
MTTPTPTLYVLTPLRDEAPNVPRLVETLRAQTRPVDHWIVLENGSTDGSKELLAALAPGGAIRAITVLNLETPQSSYALGSKYSSIVNAGIEHVTARFDLAHDDMIALLDADTFLDAKYYETLERVFAADPRVGMACGTTVRPGAPRNVLRWTGGGYFAWRHACLAEAGYHVGPSADVVSSAKAHLLGWRLRVAPEARAETRGQGRRVDFRYYGRSAYYRGETLMHCFAKAGNLAVHGRVGDALAHASGYLGDRLRGAPQIADDEIRRYFGGAFRRRLRESLGAAGDARREA